MGGGSRARRRRMRVAAGAATTTAVGVMSNVATGTAGTYWSTHGALAWALLGLLVAVLAVNECWDPERAHSSGGADRGRRRRRRPEPPDRRDWWLAAMALAAMGFAAVLWFTSRSSALPDGVDPAAFGCRHGSDDPTTVLEGTGALTLDSRELAAVELHYSPRCRAVWGEYWTEGRVDLPDPRVTITVSRSDDGKAETAADLALTDYLNAPGHALWTDTLRYRPSSRYRALATLVVVGRAPVTAATGWESF